MTSESLVLLTIRGTLVPKTLESACGLHNETAGSAQGIALFQTGCRHLDARSGFVRVRPAGSARQGRALRPVASKEQAVEAFRAALAPKLADARRRGQLTHMIFFKAPACVDTLEKKSARSLVVDSGPPADPRDPVAPPGSDEWIGPCPASLYADDAPSPEARYSSRESVALAFLAALQLLPPRQRAALLARDVLGWSAEECAEMLGSSVASMNSALQRARQTIDERASRWRPRLNDEKATRALLGRYVQAWERADVGALVSLLHQEATLSMPPLPIWLHTPDAIGASIGGMVLTADARGAFRFVAIEANGSPALAAYRRDETGRFVPSALHVLSIRDGQIDAITAFLDPGLFVRFGLPSEAG